MSITEAHQRVAAIGNEHSEPRSDNGSAAIAEALGVDKDELDALAETRAALWLPVLEGDFYGPEHVWAALRMQFVDAFLTGAMWAKEQDE